MASVLVRVMRLASLVICVIVAVSFLVFAVDQTKAGSNHQQAELNGTASSSTQSSHEGSLHKALTETANTLTSPFSGIISSSSEWASRGVKLLLALVVYGFGLGYLARVLRVRT